MYEAYYTPEEISTLLKVPKATVYTWIRNGRLYAERFGRVLRVPKSSLEEFRQPTIVRDEHSRISLMQ
jgi:excisionase family DNA binding protein